MAIQVDLVLPGLFNLPATGISADSIKKELPALNTLLRFGLKQHNHFHDIDDILSDCLGMDTNSMLPFASAYATELSTEQSSNNVLFRGIHLKPDLRNAFVIPLAENEELQNDLSHLINGLKPLFKEDCDISDLHNGLWLMHLKLCQPPNHYPHHLSIVGRKVDQYIEQSRKALPWYQLMNEMQMFLHSHEVNQKRLVNGQLPINSLWCWGAGSFREPKRQKHIWYCDDSLMQSYARRAGILDQPIKSIAQADFYQDALIVDFSLLQALKSVDVQDLALLLMETEKNILQPLLKSVKKGKAELHLRAGSDFDLLLSRQSMFKFWRSTTNYFDWLE